MSPSSEMIATDIEGYLYAHQHKSLLRFITCGSVDDGKSTLIGRMLYESHLIFEDHLEALRVDSRKFGTQGGDLDFALLVDGLSAEREQGITIDVAYRFFSTDRRKFIVADTPGHEQYTRNMVTGASTADLAVILVDARKGLLTQTRRHSYLVALLGIRSIILAVNKLDMTAYSQEVFDSIESEYRDFAAKVGLTDITAIPLSALKGDNVTSPSANMPWYAGPTLVGHLDSVEVDSLVGAGPLRMPVQWVNRPDLDFRGVSGLIVGGAARTGARVRVLPSGVTSAIARIVTRDGDLDQAVAGQSVTLVLADDLDVSRGDVIAEYNDPPQVADQFECTLVWMNERAMLAGQRYLLKIGTKAVGVTIAAPKYRINVDTLEHSAATSLALNEIGVCTISLDRPIVFDPYTENRDMGGFIVVDRLTNNTVAAGILHFALRRSQNVHWQAIEVDKQAHTSLKGHRPCVVWFTGLSGAGKSTIANLVEKRLHASGRHTYLLDGDNIRLGLNKDLGFTAADRIENVRRVGEVARLMVDAGLIVLVSLISPFKAERDAVRALVGENEYCEVFVDTPLAIAESRDPKGLYVKARRGQLANFTGIDSPYEAPEAPEVHVDTTVLAPEDAADAVLRQLNRMGVIPAIPG